MTLNEAKEALRQYHMRTGASHYHSSLSVLPILLEIKDKMQPGDVCILSKAHAVTAYKLVFEELPEKAPVQSEFGALGSGLPFALGVAFMKPKNMVYVVVGDGEMQEGSCWEARLAATRLGIENIEIHVDINEMQGMGCCPFPERLDVVEHETYKGPSWECHYWSAK